jgi:hypothetical protein
VVQRLRCDHNGNPAKVFLVGHWFHPNLNLSDPDAMHPKHQLSFDDIVFGAEALCVFHNGFAAFQIHEISNIIARPFHNLSVYPL